MDLPKGFKKHRKKEIILSQILKRFYNKNNSTNFKNKSDLLIFFYCFVGYILPFIFGLVFNFSLLGLLVSYLGIIIFLLIFAFVSWFLDKSRHKRSQVKV